MKFHRDGVETEFRPWWNLIAGQLSPIFFFLPDSWCWVLPLLRPVIILAHHLGSWQHDVIKIVSGAWMSQSSKLLILKPPGIVESLAAVSDSCFAEVNDRDFRIPWLLQILLVECLAFSADFPYLFGRICYNCNARMMANSGKEWALIHGWVRSGIFRFDTNPYLI